MTAAPDAGTVPSDAANDRISDGALLPGQIFAFVGDDGFIKRRKISKVIRYFRFDVVKSPDNYSGYC